MPVLSDDDLTAALAPLAGSGARLFVGSVVDMAGVARAKAVPLDRAGAFHRFGMGASPTWNVFCIDNHVAMTARLGVAGDQRLRADLAAARPVGDQLIWAPAEFFEQDGQPVAGCARGRARQLQAKAEAEGLKVLVGNELEFVVTNPDGSALPPHRWQAYGLGSFLSFEPFVDDLQQSLEAAGLAVEQLHAEYADYQFEVSLGPASPVEAADDVALTRLVIGRVARRHGLGASFSPLPFTGGAGNGAHLHMSFTRRGAPLLAGGHGPHGLTPEGQSALAGIVRGLPECLAVFAGSVLSPQRLLPGHWSGAFACWGLENREAAVRFCAATPANPHGASIELKCVDPSANPYLTVATMLGLALHGMADGAPAPAEVATDPALLSEAEAAQARVVRLADNQADVLALLERSQLAPSILGEDIVEALLTVRRHEHQSCAQLDAAELAERFRFAWSS
jgi:glutamine synthetase